MTNSGKNLSWSNCIIVVQICAVVTKNVSGTKMIILTNFERSEEMGGCVLGECTREESATLLVLVVGIRGVGPRLKTSVQSHGG